MAIHKAVLLSFANLNKPAIILPSVNGCQSKFIHDLSFIEL